MKKKEIRLVTQMVMMVIHQLRVDAALTQRNSSAVICESQIRSQTPRIYRLVSSKSSRGDSKTNEALDHPHFHTVAFRDLNVPQEEKKN